MTYGTGRHRRFGHRQLVSVALVAVLLLLSFSLPTVAATDDSYRRGLSFDEIKVTRQLGSSLKAGNSKVVLNTMKILKPIWTTLNEKYPVSDDEPRSLFEDVKSAVESGNASGVRSATLTFLYFDVRDMLELGQGFVSDGNSDRAKVYVKQSLMIYKSVFQRNIENVSEKKDAVRAVSTGLQKLNQSLDNVDDFETNKKQVLDGLKTMFPEIDA